MRPAPPGHSKISREGWAGYDTDEQSTRVHGFHSCAFVWVRHRASGGGLALVKHLLRHLLEGVSAIHARGFLHGDLHARNLLIKEEGEGADGLSAKLVVSGCRPDGRDQGSAD